MKTPAKKKVAKVATKQVSEEKYSATMSMGGIISTAQGNDETIFSKLSMPKVTYKCLLVVENNHNHKLFEVALAPFMAKKVLTNEYVQKFQWKRITGKIA